MYNTYRRKFPSIVRTDNIKHDIQVHHYLSVNKSGNPQQHTTRRLYHRRRGACHLGQGISYANSHGKNQGRAQHQNTVPRQIVFTWRWTPTPGQPSSTFVKTKPMISGTQHSGTPFGNVTLWLSKRSRSKHCSNAEAPSYILQDLAMNTRKMPPTWEAEARERFENNVKEWAPHVLPSNIVSKCKLTQKLSSEQNNAMDKAHIATFDG